MPVPQQVANLLNLSVPTLQRLAKETGIDVSDMRAGPATKWDYVIQLAELPQETLEAIVGDWLYAGHTSITWLTIGDGEPLKLENVREALHAMYGDDPLEKDVRPDEVTAVPQLVDARQFTDSKVVFTFAVTRRVATVLHNFEPQDVFADEFFIAVLRLDRAIVEVRASHSRAQLLANTWLAELADLL